jgi:hypothetical protein
MSIKVEPFTVGDFVHAYNRGNKKDNVFFDKSDYWRFLRALRFFNDERNIKEFANDLTGLITAQKEIWDLAIRLMAAIPLNGEKNGASNRHWLRLSVTA